MPMLDMPIEKLREYQGCTPCPSDFDAFWDRSLAEMNAIDPAPVFTPYPFPSKIADMFELRFTSMKGASIYAKFARPKHVDGRVPAVLHFHGLSGRGMEWNELVALASQGFCVASMDSRGQGGYSEEAGARPGTVYSQPFTRGLDGKPEDLMVRDLFLDTAMLARIVMGLDYVDETRVGVFGGSQGGGLSIACAALVPSIKLCAPDEPYMSDYRRVWEMDLDKDAYDGLKYYFRFYDPTHERENEIFEKLGYIDIQNLAPRIRAKVFMGTGLRDTICPPSTQFAMFNKLTCEKQVDIYPEFGHEWLYGRPEKVFRFLSEL